MASKLFVALLTIFSSYLIPVDAFWRMNCNVIQTGRIDPIINPGGLSAHCHTIVGGSNIGVNSTYTSLINSACVSCELAPDKSAYWTPNLYYQRPNGSFEEVYHTGSVVYYLGRGYTADGKQNFVPFPKGFQMVSGNKAVRAYNQTGMTWGNTTYPPRPKADAVSFACLAEILGAETPNMVNVSTCVNGLRAQIHFQSCWDGKNLYKPDNSHVAYLSSIDNGVCPPGYPVLLPHLFLETNYAVANLNNLNDGGRFVFSQGDPTGYGFHGDFMNGWDVSIQALAVKNCIGDNGFGTIEECPILQANRQLQFPANCPVQPEQIGEQVHGMLDRLPGCVNVTPGPQAATSADMECPINYPKPSITRTVDSMPMPTYNPAIGSPFGNAFNQYIGCGNDSVGSPLRTLNAISTTSTNMTVEYCQSYCTQRGYRYSGVEYATQCFCDIAINPSAQFYAGINMTVGCSMLCSGNRTELCGGPAFMNVYNNTDPGFQSTNDTTDSVYQLTVPIASYGPDYVGCASEGKHGARALNRTSTVSNNMSVGTCAAFCQDYKYYGLEYASQCFCGNDLASGAVYLDTSPTPSGSICSNRCNGNFSQVCGNAGALSVYRNPNYRPISIVQSVGKYVSKGCLTDPLNNGRALKMDGYTDTSGMTVESCVKYCQKKSYRFAGLEYASQCYCDNKVQSSSGAKAVSCSPNSLMACKGNKYEYCGGGNLLNLYYASTL